MPTPDTTRPTLRARLAEAFGARLRPRQAETNNGVSYAISATVHDLADAVLAAIADTGSPLSVEQVAEIERDVDRDHKVVMVGIDPMYPECNCGLALPCCDGDTIRLLLSAFKEVDAQRCVQASRIHELERHLAMASEAQTQLGDRTAALAARYAELEAELEERGEALVDWQRVAGDHQREMFTAQAERDELKTERDEARAEARAKGIDRDVWRERAKQWHHTHQQSAGAFDEFLGDLLELLPGAADTGSDAYDQIPRGIKTLRAERDQWESRAQMAGRAVGRVLEYVQELRAGGNHTIATIIERLIDTDDDGLGASDGEVTTP